MKKSGRLSEFERSIADATKMFEGVEKRREALIKESRDVVLFCSKAIVNVHSGDLKSAKKLLESAREKLAKLRGTAETDLERYLVFAEAEYVEARSFLQLLETGRISSIDEMEVKAASYVLGLLDVIGELKRKVFDSVRVGRRGEAERLFGDAEEIYSVIKPLAAYDNLVPGIRKKLDIDRILLEDMRALITEEVRREKLLKEMEKLERKKSE